MKSRLFSACALTLLVCVALLTCVFPAQAGVVSGPAAAAQSSVETTEYTFDTSASGQTSAPGQVIYISLSKQHMWVYEDGKQVFSFVVSSGIATRATKPGNFRVQDRIPDAWSGIWQLSMPYWMGIYNVGRVENGIHALPINKRGVRLWAGLLGRPASFGCIILNTPDAKTLYNWVKVGALVVIRN
ncbi:MAG TPA: L,D-transpeptidase family protein [Anaerolineae bacterium]